MKRTPFGALFSYHEKYIVHFSGWGSREYCPVPDFTLHTKTVDGQFFSARDFPGEYIGMPDDRISDLLFHEDGHLSEISTDHRILRWFYNVLNVFCRKLFFMATAGLYDLISLSDTQCWVGFWSCNLRNEARSIVLNEIL